VIDSLRQLGEYTDSELMAALVASLFTVFVNTPGGKSLAPFAPSEETGGTSTDEDYKLRSGAMVELAPGESIQTADPGRPNAAFDPFVVSVLRQVGVALEIPFEVLVKHFTASYSAARAALLEAWRFFSVRRQWLSRMLCQPVYEAFMDEVVAIGRIGAPGYFSDPIIRKAYLGSIWIGDAAGQIDPLKEVKAAESRLALRISTISEETAGITGGDFEKNVAQIAKERRMLRQVGINPDPAPKVGAPGNGDFPKHPEEEDTQDQLEKEELS
jgi:capsid protein